MPKKKIILFTVLSLFPIVIVGLTLYYTIFHGMPYEFPVFTNSTSKLGVYTNAAISTDGYQCAEIGKNILLNPNATATDAGIAALFCMGLVVPQSMGLGGGNIISYFDHETGQATIINARETAPSASFENMFKDLAHDSYYGRGAIATMGELMGYHTAYEKFSKKAISWKELIQPTIDLATNGFYISKHLSNALEEVDNGMDPQLRKLFTNPKTGRLYYHRDKMVRNDLAKTLQKISEEGFLSIYSTNGSIIKDVLEDLDLYYPPKNPDLVGPAIDDFVEYKADVYPSFKYSLPSSLHLPNLTLYAPNVPMSGPIMGFIMSTVLKSYPDFEWDKKLDPYLQKDVYTFIFKVIEAFKFAYSSRQFLGDPMFENNVTREVESKLRNDDVSKQVAHIINNLDKTLPTVTDYNIFTDSSTTRTFVEDHGTSAMVIVDQYGNAFSVGTTVNALFGSQVVSPTTGIILNNEMDDFNNGFVNQFGVRPTTDFNKIAPKKRPLSSTAPAIFTTKSGNEKENVFMVIGGAGGTQITTSTALITLRCLLFGEDIKTAIDGIRFHHQLLPNEFAYEAGMPQEVLDEMTRRGHNITQHVGMESIVVAIKREDINGTSHWEANSDFRKGGTVDGFY